MDFSIKEINFVVNILIDYEKCKGWCLFWDGKSFDGWIGVKLDYFLKKGWIMKDGVLIVELFGGVEFRNGGDIIIEK